MVRCFKKSNKEHRLHTCLCFLFWSEHGDTSSGINGFGENLTGVVEVDATFLGKFYMRGDNKWHYDQILRCQTRREKQNKTRPKAYCRHVLCLGSTTSWNVTCDIPSSGARVSVLSKPVDVLYLPFQCICENFFVTGKINVTSI